MTVSVSPNGKNSYQNASPSNEVLVGTAKGVYSFVRSGSGAPWRETGRSLETDHISSILIEPKKGMIFAGTHESGLWASEDGGKTWGRRDAGIPHENFYGLNCNVVGDEVRIYAGTVPEKADQTVSVVLEELGKLERDGVTEDELRRAKTLLKSNVIMRSESTAVRRR